MYKPIVITNPTHGMYSPTNNLYSHTPIHLYTFSRNKMFPFHSPGIL